MTIELSFIGDIMLSAPQPERFFAPSRECLSSSDLTVGHLEWPHTSRGQVCAVDLPAPANPPEYLDSLTGCGIDAMTMAGNHMFDQGPNGVEDSIAALRERNIAHAGAGINIDSARQPAVLERGGLRFGILSYNAVGPRESWATSVKAGVAPVRVLNHYELDIASPGSAPAEFTSLDPETLDAMKADVAELKNRVDVVCVSFHKGMGFVRASLAHYERPLAFAAVDAGADVVIGHHAHILRGVEYYRGRPIFHGINHFVAAYTPDTDPLGQSSNRPRPKSAPSIGFFEPDPGRAPFPFPRESRYTIIAQVRVDEAGGIVEAGFIPCHIDTDAVPVPLSRQDAEPVVNYMSEISREAGLNVRFEQRDRDVAVQEVVTEPMP